MQGIGNLQQRGVKPLRNVIPTEERQTVSRVSVESLKNGGGFNVSTGSQAEETETSVSIRSRYTGRSPAPSARRGRQSQLDTGEQIEQLKKIKKSANEYEAVFMDQLVKAMRQSPMAKTPGGDTFSDIAEQPFTAFLSQAGGLGLADQIVGQVARQEGLEQTLQEHPGIMGPGWQMKTPANHMRKAPGGLDIGIKAFKEQAPEAKKAEATEALTPAATGPGPLITGLMDEEEIAYLYRDLTSDIF